MKKPSLIFVPKSDVLLKKNSLIPVYARIIFNQKKSEFKLNTEMTIDEFQYWSKTAQLVEKKDAPINQEIIFISEKFKKLIQENESILSHMTALEIRNKLSKKIISSRLTLLDYLTQYFDKHIYSSIDHTVGTKKNYIKAEKHFKKFIYLNNYSQISISAFTIEDANQLYKYLIVEDSSLKKTKMKPYSAAQIFKKYKSVFNQAVQEGYILSNPLNSIKLSNEYKQKTPLNLNEIKKIIESDFNFIPELEKAKDIFLFMFYTGLAYSDAMNLRKDNIIVLENNNALVSGTRLKTGEQFKFILINQANEIIQKYEPVKESNRREYALPFMSDQYLNRLLKSMADRLSIKLKITTHIARHSINQFIEDEGLNDQDAIFSMMGWGRKKNIRSNYSKISNLRLIQFKALLQEKIDYLINLEKYQPGQLINPGLSSQPVANNLNYPTMRIMR